MDRRCYMSGSNWKTEIYSCVGTFVSSCSLLSRVFGDLVVGTSLERKSYALNAILPQTN